MSKRKENPWADVIRAMRDAESVLCGTIPNRSYGEGPHAKKYMRQLERINLAVYSLDNALPMAQRLIHEHRKMLDLLMELGPEDCAGDSGCRHCKFVKLLDEVRR